MLRDFVKTWPTVATISTAAPTGTFWFRQSFLRRYTITCASEGKLRVIFIIIHLIIIIIIYLTRRNNNYWCKSGGGCRLVMVVVECIMGHGCAISKRLRLEIILSPSPPANGIAEQVFKILKTNKIIIGVRIQYYLILGWDVVAFCAQFFFHN